MLPNKKSSILLVLKVLEEYTDEEHYLTQQEIADKIYQVYDIELERKSVGSSLSMLEELDYDIDKGLKQALLYYLELSIKRSILFN